MPSRHTKFCLISLFFYLLIGRIYKKCHWWAITIIESIKITKNPFFLANKDNRIIRFNWLMCFRLWLEKIQTSYRNVEKSKNKNILSKKRNYLVCVMIIKLQANFFHFLSLSYANPLTARFSIIFLCTMSSAEVITQHTIIVSFV